MWCLAVPDSSALAARLLEAGIVVSYYAGYIRLLPPLCIQASELRQTLVLALPLHEASAKMRSGGPVDDVDDYKLPVWAGVVPMAMVKGEPVEDR